MNAPSHPPFDPPGCPQRDRSRTRSRLLGIALSVASIASFAADVDVLAAGAAKELVTRLQTPFAEASGHRLKATFDTVGAQRERIEKGERPDAVILSNTAIARLGTLGFIDPGSIRDVGDVQVGLAVAANASNAVNATSAAQPDVSTPAALRATLLSAKSIAYADPARGATAGAHFAKVLAALGIYDQVSAKVTVLPFGVEVIEAVAAGKYEIGVSQSSEIVQHGGVRYIGALPVPHRLATRYQIAALKDRPVGVLLADFVATERGKQASRESGFEVP